jgi:hypothetical protein
VRRRLVLQGECWGVAMNITGSSFHLRWQPLSVERVGARQADARLERGEFTHDLEEVNPLRRDAVVLLSETKPANMFN